MTGFGASAPAKDLFKHFGITPEAVVKAAEKHVWVKHPARCKADRPPKPVPQS